jgi:hypothetical protein
MARRRRGQREARQQPRTAASPKPAPSAGAGSAEATSAAADPTDRRRAATTCGWCGGPIQPKARGRIPTWCSPACRQRAWEQSRAAASGRAAVQVVERRVEVPTRLPLSRRDWPQALHELAQQLDDGRITTATSPGCPSHSTPSSRPTTAGPTSASEPPTSAARSGVPDAHLIDECARGNWRTGEQQEARVRQPRRTCPERPSPVSSSRGSGNWRSAGARAALPCQQDLAHPSGTGGGPEVARPSSTYGRAGGVSV